LILGRFFLGYSAIISLELIQYLVYKEPSGVRSPGTHNNRANKLKSHEGWRSSGEDVCLMAFFVALGRQKRGFGSMVMLHKLGDEYLGSAPKSGFLSPLFFKGGFRGIFKRL
jgi:hypothetical protein